MAILESGSSTAPIEMRNETNTTRLIGTITFCSSSIRETSAPADGEQRRVEREPEDEPSHRDRRGRQRVGGDVDRTGHGRERHREDGDQDQLEQAERPDARDLAGHQLTGTDRGEQHLDDTRGLLLDHAGRHPHPVAEELAVEDEHGREGNGRLRVTVRIRREDRHGIDRVLVLQGLDRGIGHPRIRERIVDPLRDRRCLYHLVEEARCGAEDLQGRGAGEDVGRVADHHGVDVTGSERAIGGAFVGQRNHRHLDPGPLADRGRTIGHHAVAHHGEVERVRTARERAQEDEDRKHSDRDRRGDHEPFVAQTHGEVPCRDDPPHAAVRRSGIVAHVAVTSLNSSDSVGRTRLKCRTSPTDRARSRTR